MPRPKKETPSGASLPRPDDAEPGVDIPEEEDVDESTDPNVAPSEEEQPVVNPETGTTDPVLPVEGEDETDDQRREREEREKRERREGGAEEGSEES